MFVEDKENRDSTAEAKVSQVNFYCFHLCIANKHERIERILVSAAV